MGLASPHGSSAQGLTLIEAMAALALLALAITTSVALLQDGRRFSAGQAAAEDRLLLAASLMERTLALPFEARASRSFAPGQDELSGRRVRATVSVRFVSAGLQRIEIIVRDGRSRAKLVTLSAPLEVRP